MRSTDSLAIHIALHENELTLSLLENAYADHYRGMVWFKVAPNLDPLRTITPDC